MAAPPPAPPPQPVPNVANLQAAVTGMTAQGNNMAQNFQTSIGHQQALNTELARCGNYNVAQIHQQYINLRRDIAEFRTLYSAESFNLKAQIQNSKVDRATAALIVMRSVDQRPNAQVQINQPIPNFPATPDVISQMTVAQCRDLLTALDHPIPQNAQVRQLRTAVRGAVGLPAL